MATTRAHSPFIDSETGRRDLRLDRTLHVPETESIYSVRLYARPRLVGSRKFRVDMPGIDVAAGQNGDGDELKYEILDWHSNSSGSEFSSMHGGTMEIFID